MANPKEYRPAWRHKDKDKTRPVDLPVRPRYEKVLGPFGDNRAEIRRLEKVLRPGIEQRLAKI